MVRTRLAPSPTGDPHIGTIFQAFLNYAFAKKNKGKFIVRIEDTDRDRYVKGAETALFDALDWFGLTPDESVKHQGDFGPYRQSENLEKYQQHAEKLVKLKKAYYCFCSPTRLEKVRKNLQKQGQPPMYDGQCEKLDPIKAAQKAKNKPHVIRMKIEKSNNPIILHDDIRGDIKFDRHVLDDQVLLKSDGFPTYHLAVVIDDHFMKISHVIRGEEWISSAPKHVLLYQYFGWQPPSFIHTPLLRNKDKSKLSKRHGHASVSWYQKKGYLPQAILNFLATRVWNHPDGQEIFSLKEFIQHFNFSAMHIQGPVIDLDKLNWLNSQWIRKLDKEDPKTLFNWLEKFKPKDLSKDKLIKIWPLIKERIEVLSELKYLTEYFVTSPEPEPKTILKESKKDNQDTKAYLLKLEQVIKNIKPWTVKQIDKDLHAFQAKTNWKPRPAFMTIRLALTNRSATPPLFDIIAILGKETVLQRLKHVQEKI